MARIEITIRKTTWTFLITDRGHPLIAQYGRGRLLMLLLIILPFLATAIKFLSCTSPYMLLSRYGYLNGSRRNLLINSNTKICSEHFVNAHGRRLYADEVPGLLLPASARAQKARREPRERSTLLQEEGLDELEENEREVSTQTEVEVPGEHERNGC